MKKIAIALGATLLASGAQSGTSSSYVALEMTGLTRLVGQHYEGWNIVDGAPVSTGRFNITKKNTVYSVDASGAKLDRLGSTSRALFSISPQAVGASVFVLTIEPNGDKDLGPSATHIVGGDYDGAVATATMNHPAAFSVDFSSVSGSVIMAAPTGEEANKGVWFVNPESGSASLELPELPEGWAFEGWVVNKINGKKVSTGIFKDAAKADSDNAGVFAGAKSLDFPPFPGQDYIKTHLEFDDGKHVVVVTVEPYPDYDARPSDIKILKAPLVLGQEPGTNIGLENIVDGNSPAVKALILR